MECGVGFVLAEHGFKVALQRFQKFNFLFLTEEELLGLPSAAGLLIQLTHIHYLNVYIVKY